MKNDKNKIQEAQQSTQQVVQQETQQETNSTQSQDKLTKTIVVSKTVKVKTKKGTRTTVANKTVREEKIVELDNFTIPCTNSVVVLLRRDVLNTMFYNNYCTKEETEKKLEEIDAYYTEQIRSLKSTLIATDIEEKEKELLEEKQKLINREMKKSLFTDATMNNKAILIFSYLCFCRQAKGNEEIVLRTGRKTKEEEKIIKVNNNSILRIDLKEMITYLELSQVNSISVSELKNIFKVFEELKLLKFKEFNKKEYIYDLILTENVFNYRFICSEIIESRNENGYIRFSGKEFFRLRESARESETKFYSIFCFYIGLKDLAPNRYNLKHSEVLADMTNRMTEEEFRRAYDLELESGTRTISYETLVAKINNSRTTISSIIKLLEEREMLKVIRGGYNPSTKTRVQNLYKILC